MNKPVVFYTDPYWALDERGNTDPRRAELERAVLGSELELALGSAVAGRFPLDGAALLQQLARADAVVIYRFAIEPHVVEVLRQRCRVVVRQGVGVDNLNAELLARHGVPAYNVPDYCVDEVTAHALAFVLALERGICLQNTAAKSGRWSIRAGNLPRRLSSLTLGIVGFGRIGKLSASKLRHLFGELVAFDPYVHADLMAGYGVARAASLQELLGRSDVVILHAALTPETRRLINAQSVHWFKPGATLINVARGALVDSAAVLVALEQGRLAGFASDVFVPEDPNLDATNRKLLERDDVLVSCHRAFLSDAAEQSQRRRTAEIAATILRGERPREVAPVAPLSDRGNQP